MPANLRRDASFIIRIWWEPRPDASLLWRGQVIHVWTGQSRYFDCLEDLLSFIAGWTGIQRPAEAVEPLPPEDRERKEVANETS